MECFKDFLVAKGCPGSSRDLTKVLVWLQAEDVTSHEDLTQLRSLSTFNGVENFQCDIIAFIDALIKKGIDVGVPVCIAAEPEPEPKKARIAAAQYASHIRAMRSLVYFIVCGTRLRLTQKSLTALASSQAPIAARLEELLAYRPTPIVDASAQGPCLTIKSMEFPKVASSRRVWFAHARMAAVLGSCPKSLESFRSGLRCYMKFAVKAYGCVADGFPPSVDGILAWSNIFRCVGTFTNYVAHVRCACCALNVQCPQPGDPAIARAKVTVVKRMVESDKPRMFIQRALVRRLIAVTYQSPDDLRFAMLWLAAYAFLLRVPSEALGMRRGGGEFTKNT